MTAERRPLRVGDSVVFAGPDLPPRIRNELLAWYDRPLVGRRGVVAEVTRDGARDRWLVEGRFTRPSAPKVWLRRISLLELIAEAAAESEEVPS